MDPRFIQQLECVPDTEGGEAAFVVLEQKVEKGAKRRFGCIGEFEKNRLAYEFELIRATNTAKLFLYWADVVATIRQKTYPYIYSVQNCSLVSYCLGITEVNPLLVGSYFERLLTRRSTHVPILFIEVPKGRGREASDSLGGEVKSLIEIEENTALPDLDPIDVMDFFKRATFENRELLQSAAASLGLAGQKPLETVRALADLLVYKRYKEFMDEKPSLLYQEDAVDLLVKAGLSYEEAECARRAFAMKNRSETTSCRKMFERAARKNGYSIGEANAMFSAIEKEINFTVCRASYVAMAQYLYMDMFFQEKQRDEQLMFVKKLTVEQFGRIGYKSFLFEQPLTIFAGEEMEEIFAALCIVLDNRLLRLQTTRYCFTEKSKLYAEIEKSGKVYMAEAAYDESVPNNCVVRIYCGGRLLSNEERTAAFQTSLEEEECSYFINRYDYYSRYVPFAELDFTKKMAGYRQDLQEENWKVFSARTDGIGLTHTFRKVLKNFCDKFLPQQLRIEKRLWLTMDEDGSFSAKYVSPRKDLSATENTLLQYYCFLEVNRFWGEVQNATGRTVQKPLFIGALADKIDFCIDLASLLEKASDLNRQVFVFTRDKNIAERIQETERIMLP